MSSRRTVTGQTECQHPARARASISMASQRSERPGAVSGIPIKATLCSRDCPKSSSRPFRISEPPLARCHLFDGQTDVHRIFKIAQTIKAEQDTAINAQSAYETLSTLTYLLTVLTVVLVPVWAGLAHGPLSGILCAAAEVPITTAVVGVYDFLFAATPIGGPIVALFWCSMVLLLVVASLLTELITTLSGRGMLAPRHDNRGAR